MFPTHGRDFLDGPWSPDRGVYDARFSCLLGFVGERYLPTKPYHASMDRMKNRGLRFASDCSWKGSWWSSRATLFGAGCVGGGGLRLADLHSGRHDAMIASLCVCVCVCLVSTADYAVCET